MNRNTIVLTFSLYALLVVPASANADTAALQASSSTEELVVGAPSALLSSTSTVLQNNDAIAIVSPNTGKVDNVFVVPKDFVISNKTAVETSCPIPVAEYSAY